MKNTWKVVRKIIFGDRFSPFHNEHCWNVSFMRDTTTTEGTSEWKHLRRCKKLRSTLRMRYVVSHSSVWNWNIFKTKCCEKSWTDVENEKFSQAGVCLEHCSIVCKHCLMIYTDSIEQIFVWNTRFYPVFFFQCHKQQTIYLLECRWTIRSVVTYIFDRCFKVFSIV